eukprot:9358945-Lingulodinium_polyedra.AAC.1
MEEKPWRHPWYSKRDIDSQPAGSATDLNVSTCLPSHVCPLKCHFDRCCLLCLDRHLSGSNGS